VIKTLSRAALLMVVLMLASCGTTKAVRAPTQPTASEALVYFVRYKYPPYVHQIRMSSNGSPVATLKNSDYVAVNLPVGENSITLDVTDGTDFTFDLRVEKPEVMYVVLTGEVETKGVSTGYRAVTVHLQTNLHAYRVAREEAESIVAGFGKQLQ
jgi:hypothetical protein